MESKFKESKREAESKLSAEKIEYGDWVSYQGRRVKVIANNHYTAIVEDEEGVISCVHYPDLSPIKLTEAIFEANGWNYWCDQFTKEYTWFTIVVDRFQSLCELCVGLRSEREYVHICNIRYVHELQHLLSTLKTKDNIKL